MDFLQRLVASEPVKGRAGGDRVDRAGREWDRLGGAGQGPNAGERGLEHGAHLRHGLDGDDLRPGPHQERRQLSGARGQVEDCTAGAEVQLSRQPRDRLRRIGRPALVIRRGRAGESLRGRVVKLGAHRLPGA